MSGHSHAKTIKHQKNITDQKRGQFFSKMARVISVAVKQGGPNPETNTKLKTAFEKAKESNMPKENIERAVKQAIGGIEGANLEEIALEAFGPNGIALIIETITDNRNRTLGEIKQILNQAGGKLANEGSVKWLFERKGAITINPAEQNEETATKEKLELIAIEAGAQDFYWHENLLDVFTKPEELEAVKKSLEGRGVKIDSASLDWVAKEEVPLNDEGKTACQKLFDTLDENESVQEIYSNIKLP